MKAIAGVGLGIWYFFVEDGAIVVGTIIALLLIGGLAAWRPSVRVEYILGPLLFVLIAGLLSANLVPLAHRAGSRSRRNP
jgi:hypothetical protein